MSLPPKLTYEITHGGKAILCKTCNHTSYHPKDVEHRYCGNCSRFHPYDQVSHDQVAILQALRDKKGPPQGLEDSPHRMMIALFQRGYLGWHDGEVILTQRAIEFLDVVDQA